MRFALVATCVAAVVAVPLAVHASGPQMSRSEFLSAVSCVAHRSASAPNGAYAAAEYRLNAEVRRQTPDAAAQVRAIARQAVNGAGAANEVLVDAESAACAGTALIAGARAHSAA